MTNTKFTVMSSTSSPNFDGMKEEGFYLIMNAARSQHATYVLNNFHKNINSEVCIAEYYRNQGDISNMIKWCEIAINKSNDPFALMKLGGHYQKIEQYDQMMKYYLVLLELYPKYQSVYSNLGIYYENELKDIEKSVELYLKGHELGNITCTVNLAKHYYEKGDEEKGTELMKYARARGYSGEARFELKYLKRTFSDKSWYD